ncbi:MAG: hypothetical protein KatS3mg026_0414 [Bacteroidia bacterium]|nr:MAG: hypothetical protein KatS3mg026_0414 [Bacteroidia bacterium]
MSELYSRRCRSCGASFVYDPQSETLKCPYCGSQETLTPSYEGIQEIDLEEALQAAQTPTSLTGYHVVYCQSCGAEIACQEVRAACGFCGSENVSEKALQALPVKPQGVLPFRVSQEEARAAFDRWVRSLWLAPSDLKDKRQIEKIRGFYLPIWTFDAQVWAHWRAEPGYYRTRTERYFDPRSRSWQSRTVTYVEWGPPVSGHHQDFYDDVLVSGLVSLPTSYLDSVGGFATPSDLQAYNPDYFLGWEVALPDKPLPAAWKEAYQRIYEMTAEACKRALPGDTHRNFSMRLQLSGLTTKLAYVPLYVVAYRYKGKPYRVVIHGRSGAVHGESPLSWVKVTLLVLALLVGVGLLAWLSGR